MEHKAHRKPETVTAGNVMVKIYKHNRRTANGKPRTDFLISDYTAGARRLRWFADHGKARAHAEKIARQISTGQVTASTMRNSEAASYGRAIELLRATGVSLELVAARFAEAFKILGSDKIIEAAHFYRRHSAGQLTRKKVAEVVSELIALMEAKGKSDRYIGDLKARLTRFAGSFAVDISTVTTPDIQRWLDGLKVGAQTTKNFRQVLNRLFSFAESRGYVFKGGNPVEDTESVSANGSAVEIFTPDEITKLLTAASPDFLPCLAVQAFCGLRSAEVERMEWQDVDTTRRQIILSASKAKTASRRIVPVPDNLAIWLADYAGCKGKLWTAGHDAFYDAQQETAKAAGVKWKQNALRHSWISYRLALTQNAAQTSLEAGNSAHVVFRHYREIVQPEDAQTWFKVAPAQPENIVSMRGAK